MVTHFVGKIMKQLLFTFSLFMTFSAWSLASAETEVESFENQLQKIDEKVRIDEIRSYLEDFQGPSCLNEYLEVRKKMARRLWLTPLVGVAAVPAGGILGAIASGAVASVIYPADGWATLGFAAIGGYVFIISGVTIVVTREVQALTRFFSSQYMARTIYDAHVGQGENLEHAFERFQKRRRFRNVQQHASLESFRHFILQQDSELTLCDGTFRRRNSSRIQRQVSMRRHLLRAYARHLRSQS